PASLARSPPPDVSTLSLHDALPIFCFQLHPHTPAVALLAAEHLRVDVVLAHHQPGRQPLHDRGQRLPMRFPGRQKAEHPVRHPALELKSWTVGQLESNDPLDTPSPLQLSNSP